MEDGGLAKLRQMTTRTHSGSRVTIEDLVPVSPCGPMYYEQNSRRTKDGMKLERERLQVNLIVEERKALRLLQLQREREKQHLRELRVQQLGLARLHSHRRIMYFCGLKPWLDLVQSCRSFAGKASFHSVLALVVKSFRAWKLVLSSEQRERNVCRKLLHVRADYFRSRWLQRRSWRAWIVLQRAVSSYSWGLLRSCLSAWKKYCAAGLAVYFAYLLKHTWSTWLRSLEEMKSAKLLKDLEREGVADGHARRVLQRNVLNGWQKEACRGKLEAGKIKRHAEAWVKIHSWLEELEQNKHRPTSIARQPIQTGV